MNFILRDYLENHRPETASKKVFIFTLTYPCDIHGKLISDNADGEAINYTYDNVGNQLTMTDSTGTTTRTYDELGRVLTKTAPLIGTTTFTYDQTAGLTAGFSAEVSTDPKGNVTTRVYDKSGRLYQVKDGSTAAATYTYYANGNRQKVEYPGGATEEYTYYANNLLHTLTNKKGITTLEAYSYAYDAAGNMSSKADRKGTTSYTYDGLNRLLTVIEPGGKVTGYSFDEAGNRIQQQETSGSDVTITSYSYNGQNRLVATETSLNSALTGGESYYYDANGNMVSSMPYSLDEASGTADSSLRLFALGDSGTPKSAGAVYEYDNRNNMVKAVSGSDTTLSKYNGDGLRVEKKVNGNACHYAYEYDKIVLEVDGSNTQTARNIYGLSLVKRTAGAESYSYLYNGHGDVTALLNSSGNIAVQYYSTMPSA